MKNFIFNKWLGVLTVITFSLIFSIYTTNAVMGVVRPYIPKAIENIDEYLPITISGGQIVAPENKVVARNFGSEEKPFNVILDTRVSDMDTNSLPAGVYISKNKIYSVSAKKIEIQSLSTFPNMVIDRDVAVAGAEAIEEHAGKYVFALLFLFILLWSMLAILVYTILMHWLLAIIYHCNFSQTLRINTLSYVAIFALAIISGLELSFLVKIVLFTAINIGINMLGLGKDSVK